MKNSIKLLLLTILVIAITDQARAQRQACTGVPVNVSASGTVTTSIQWSVYDGTIVDPACNCNEVTTSSTVKTIKVVFDSPTGNETVSVYSRYNNTDHETKFKVASSVNYVCSLTSDRVTVCAGGTVRFTASTGIGGTGTQYSFRVNGVTKQNTTSNIYDVSTLNDDDKVTVQLFPIMPPSAVCYNVPLSNEIKIDVNPSLPVSMSIFSTKPDPICSGEGMGFAVSSNPQNLGSTPQYRWYLNGDSQITSDVAGMSADRLARQSWTYPAGTYVVCKVISSAPCATPYEFTSNKIYPQYRAQENFGGGIQILPDRNPKNYCEGEISFKTTPSHPANLYLWTKNGQSVGSNSDTYVPVSFQTGDNVSVTVYATNTLCLNNTYYTASLPPNTGNATITIYPRPSPPTVTDKVILYGTATTLDATGANPSTEMYRWYNPQNVATNSWTYPTPVLTAITNYQVTKYLTLIPTCESSPRKTIKVTPNKNPLVDAGPDRTVPLPLTTLTITGSASDPDGPAPAVVWSKQSGPSVSLSNQNTTTVTLSGIWPGTYVFRLTATDNYNFSVYDEMTLIVTNQAPIVNAGPDQNIVAPLRSVQFNGTAADNDGTISSIGWQQLTGPAVTILNPSLLNPSINNLIDGTYVFRLIATDQFGLSSYDDITIVASHPPNNYNYVRVHTPQQTGYTIATDVKAVTDEKKKMMSTTYLDGIARPMQATEWKLSPASKDIATPIAYDQFGREHYHYLPYATTEINGSFKTGATGSAISFYGTGGLLPKDTDPVGESFYEPSPLNRVVKQSSPGAAWHQGSDTDPYFQNDHTARNAYELNLDTDKIVRFSYDFTTGSLGVNTDPAKIYYAANTLHAIKTYDEATHLTIEFKDNAGKTICKKVQYGTASQFAITYYVYDAFDNLAVVLPPEGFEKAKTALNLN